MKHWNIRMFWWECAKHGEWIGVADCFSHTFHFPRFIRHRICDAWDRYLGVTDDEMEKRAPETPGEVE